MRAFDQPRYIRDDKATIVTHTHNTEVGRERREWIIRDLRPRRRHARDKGRLAGVRITNQSDVREQLQLEAELLLFARLAGLYFARRTIRRSRKMRIPETAASALRDQDSVALVCEIGEQDAGSVFGALEHERAGRDRQLQVLAVTPGAVRAFPIATAI